MYICVFHYILLLYYFIDDYISISHIEIIQCVLCNIVHDIAS